MEALRREMAKKGEISRDEDSNSEIIDELVEYPDVEYIGAVNFSRSAITKLSDRLKGDEERNTKKLVYLEVVGKLDPLTWKESWLEVDASDDTGPFPLSCIDYYMLQDMPPELKELTDYGCAVWRSKIVVVGGCPRILTPNNPNASDKVFMYDLVSKKWETQLMNVKRWWSPTVVVAGDNLFVFGGNPPDKHRKDKDEARLQALAKQWCEFFDPDTKSWTCFPDPTPIHIAKMNYICEHVVYPNQHLILFWMCDWRIASFDYKDRKWVTYEDCTPIVREHLWSGKVVVLEDFLFWNDCTTIYAHDLCEHITLPVYTLPVSKSFGYQASFLVHIGKGMLCLFCREDRGRILYITFLVKINWGLEAPTIHLVADRTGFLNTPYSNLAIALALEISSGEEGNK